MASKMTSAPPIGARLQSLRSNSLLTGSAVLFVSTTVVNLGNYLFNLIIGRWLGPAAFADVSLVVTMMLIVTLITATVQTVVAKFSAAFDAQGNARGLQQLERWSRRWALYLGLVFAAGLIFGAGALQKFFHTESFVPFILLGVGIPLYFVQGVGRGILQGQLRFGALAISYQAEMIVRLAAGIALVAAGFSVNGAVGALTLSFLASWLAVRFVLPALQEGIAAGFEERTAVLRFAGPVAAALVGQILINNSDVLVVKRFFAAEDAGQYAALALIGRIVFFATWSVVTVLLPMVAKKHEQGEPHWRLLWISTALVALVSVGIVAGSYLWADIVVGILFGPAYVAIAPLLWLYAIATTLYALANVFITYRLSTGNGVGSWIAVGGGTLQVIVLTLFHTSLRQIVIAQILLMGAMLLCIIVWELLVHRAELRQQGAHALKAAAAG